MAVTTISFDVEGFGGGIESVRIGDHVEVTYQGYPVIGFDVNDHDARDWTIASLLDSGLKGRAIAALCQTRPSQVSKVKARLREGGYRAILRRPAGRKAVIVGTRLERARALRRQGRTMREIGAALGVSAACVTNAIKGMPRGGEAQQKELIDQGVFPRVREESTASSWEAMAEDAGDDQGETEVELATELLADSLAEIERELATVERESTDDGVVVDRERADVDREPTEDEAVAEGGPAEHEAAAEGEAPPRDHVSSTPAADRPTELVPGEPLPPTGAEHPCRYAGTLLIGAAVQVLGVWSAIAVANVRRPKKAVYDGWQAIVALLAAWASGLGSLEAMHERDARSLGVVLGLERSPSVRTLHRALAQMTARFNPVKLGTALLRGLFAAVGQVPRIFGVDGHFKPYYGKEPIDKGYDTKRRMGHRGLQDVLIHDEQGRIWAGTQVGAGDKLSEHLRAAARRLRRELGDDQEIVLGFDRGGFCLAELDGLDRESFRYVAWVPATVNLPDLSSVAPATDGVGERRFAHADLGADHRARLLVQRDGEALVPALTNLPEAVDAAEALAMLRRVRGAQENDFKAARSFAHIDRLVDRGGARREPDDRLVDNPVYRELSQRRRDVRSQLEALSRSEPISAKDKARLAGKQLAGDFEEAVLNHKLSRLSPKVPRVALEPAAERAWLKTTNRALLQPLKYALANGRRWLLSALAETLAPSDAEWDHSAVARTLEALIRAPGTVRFEREEVVVTLELPLPPQPHDRLARGLIALDRHGLRFTDRRRRVLFRLAPRPTRRSLPPTLPHRGALEIARA